MARVVLYAFRMRTTNLLSISIGELATVTGGKGCGKKQQPPPQAPPPEAAPQRPFADVTVATGAAGGQAIQQALQGGGF